MNTIELHVGGRSYAISCDPGEEAHVRALGEAIDAKYRQMAPRYSQNLLFASLQLADELHEARKATDSALVAKRQIQDGYDAFREKSAQDRRDADTALGQRDEMRGRISELEHELDRLQSAQQSATEETSGIRKELTDLRQKEAEWHAEESKLLSNLASLREQLAAERQKPVAVEPPAVPAGMPANSEQSSVDLTSALEKFAVLLEETADKLERQAATS